MGHQRVVVVGAGYAGVRVAYDLGRARQRGENLDVVLVNDSHHHLETPTLYEVATAVLDRESTLSSETVEQSVCVPLNDIFAGMPVAIHQQRVTAIDIPGRLVHWSSGSISFDYLVVAVGASLATYGIPGVSEYAFSVKTLHESLELRHRIVRQFMRAKKLPPAEQAALLSFIVVGAGAAGVETAAELAGEITHLSRRHGIDPTAVHILLAEASDDILRMAPPPLREYTRQRLARLEIEISTGRAITAVHSDGVIFADGSKAPAAVVVWTGGLKAHPLFDTTGLPRQSWGVACENTMQVVGHPHIFVAGDCAVLAKSTEKIPGIVPVAYTQGRLVARNIVHLLHEQPQETYTYRSLGALIAVGGKKAVAVWPKRRGWAGVVPWIIKKLVTLHYWYGYLSLPDTFRFWWRSIRLHSHND